MKLSLFLVTLTLMSCSHKVPVSAERTPSAETTTAMFSPWEGVQAFEKMYSAIANAKNEAKITVYSWSDTGFDKAIEAAVLKGVDVKVVLHPSLAKTPVTQERVSKLENLKGKGKASFKIAPRNMHEKFALIDGEFLVNSSANMSNGAKTKYSENFVFLNGPAHLLQSFDNEFSVLWNSSKDVITSPTDGIDERLPYQAGPHFNGGKDVALYSSSMNYDYVENATSTEAYQSGKFIKLSAKGGGKGPYTVRDALINGINNAKSTILCSFNHFNMLEISQALVNAAKRGVDVRLTVDNQEFRERWNEKGIEMTPHFFENWKKLPGNEEKTAPIRVKFYSLYPNPALWLLNHHKFILIDNGSPKAVLFTGSYNLSETAEHNQFDNMVGFSGVKYASLHKSFLDEFKKLWDLERPGDKPNREISSHFTKVDGGLLPIHHNRAVSLSFEEIIKIRKDIRTMAPDFLRQLNMKTSSCKGFDVEKKVLVGCR